MNLLDRPGRKPICCRLETEGGATVPQHGEGGREAVTTWRKRGGREGGRRRLKMDAAAAWGMSGGRARECGMWA
jgi:hypothetical protein